MTLADKMSEALSREVDSIVIKAIAEYEASKAEEGLHDKVLDYLEEHKDFSGQNPTQKDAYAHHLIRLITGGRDGL